MQEDANANKAMAPLQLNDDGTALPLDVLPGSCIEDFTLSYSSTYPSEVDRYQINSNQHKNLSLDGYLTTYVPNDETFMKIEQDYRAPETIVNNVSTCFISQDSSMISEEARAAMEQQAADEERVRQISQDLSESSRCLEEAMVNNQIAGNNNQCLHEIKEEPWQSILKVDTSPIDEHANLDELQEMKHIIEEVCLFLLAVGVPCQGNHYNNLHSK